MRLSVTYHVYCTGQTYAQVASLFGGGTVPHAPFSSFPVKTLCPRPSFPLERENMTLGMGSRCNAPLGACSWAFFEKDDLG